MSMILSSVKKNLGIMDEYSHFDADLVIYINSAFSTLHQLGVGPESDFSIDSDDEKSWSDFIEDEKYIGMVQTYVTLYTKLLFDPPQSSFVVELCKEKMSELEWRLNIEFDKSTKEVTE